MSDPFGDRPFPKGALIAAAGLVVAGVVSAALGRYADIGVTRMPTSIAIETRDLQFTDRSDGAIDVFDHASGQHIGIVAAGGDGFVRGVLRGLARERKREGVDKAPPFQLIRYADGRMAVADPTTGREVDLGAFGPTNYSAFKDLFESARAQRAQATNLTQSDDSSRGSTES